MTLLLAAASAIVVAFLAACRAAPPAPAPHLVAPSEEELAQLPLHFEAQLQVIQLREVPPVAETFPAAGFRLQGGSLVASAEPDTLAGVELTQEEFERWVQELQAARAELYMAPVFTVWPGRPAVKRESAEVPYGGNWLFRNGMSTPLPQMGRRGMEVSLLPTPLVGRKEAIINLDVSWTTARLRDFQPLQSLMSGKRRIAGPLNVQIPDERAQTVSAAFPMRDGCALIAAHFVRQTATPETGRVREHFFYVLAMRRIGKEDGSSPPSVPAPLPERRELALASVEWAQPAPDAPVPQTAEEAFAAAAGSGRVDVWTCGVLCSPDAAASCSWKETSRGVTGLQSDPDGSSHRFTIGDLSAGTKATARFNPADVTKGAELDAQFAFAPVWMDIMKTMDSPRGDQQEEFHFQAGRQYSADAKQTLSPSVGWTPLNAGWSPRVAGDAPEETTGNLGHFAAARLVPAPMKAE